VALVAALVATVVAAVLIGGLAAATGASLDDPPPAVTILTTVFQDAALIGAALVFAGLAGRVSPADFGLRPVRMRVAAGALLTAWGGFFLFTAIWAAALNLHEKEDLPSQLGADQGTVALVAVIVLVTAIAPIAEEFFFRGFFFTALSNWKGPLPAAVITGIVFGAIHTGSAPVGFLVPLAVLGFALCLVYRRTGSLLPCIALHCLNNSLAFGVSEGWTAWQVLALMGGVTATVVGGLASVSQRAAQPAPA
jgi:membrane protease YdiL (CAAX protease family)